MKIPFIFCIKQKTQIFNCSRSIQLCTLDAKINGKANTCYDYPMLNQFKTDDQLSDIRLD